MTETKSYFTYSWYCPQWGYTGFLLSLSCLAPETPTPHSHMTIAEERIERLASLAREAATECNDDRAKEYVRLARRLAERNRVALPKEFKRFTCDSCDRYLRPGKNARVRLQDGHVVITCDCGTQARYPYES